MRQKDLKRVPVTRVRVRLRLRLPIYDIYNESEIQRYSLHQDIILLTACH
jgi:hypothetical protein